MLQHLALLLFLPSPKARSHLLEKDLKFQLELLEEASLFLFSKFFQKCPQCQKPAGHLGRIEAMLHDGEVKTHTSENILLAGAGSPVEI